MPLLKLVDTTLELRCLEFSVLCGDSSPLADCHKAEGPASFLGAGWVFFSQMRCEPWLGSSLRCARVRCSAARRGAAGSAWLSRPARGAAAAGQALAPALGWTRRDLGLYDGRILYWHSRTRYFPFSFLFWLVTGSCEFRLWMPNGTYLWNVKAKTKYIH